MSIGSVTHLSKYMSHTVKNIWTSETFWIRSSSTFTNPCGNLYVPTFMIDGLDWWWNHPPQYCAPGESCPVPLNLLIRHLALTIFVTTQIDILSVPSFTWKVGNQDMPNWSKFTNLNWRNKSGFIESSTIDIWQTHKFTILQAGSHTHLCSCSWHEPIIAVLLVTP